MPRTEVRAQTPLSREAKATKAPGGTVDDRIVLRLVIDKLAHRQARSIHVRRDCSIWSESLELTCAVARVRCFCVDLV